jgi:pyruvate kinase
MKEEESAAMRKTKIVATIGPASDAPEMIERLILAGMDVARLNFSHGTHEEHAKRIALLRATAKRLGRPLAILQDLQGPKIRTGGLWEHRPIRLESGASFTITTRDVVGDREIVSTTYSALPRDVRAGDRVLLSDGLIELRVVETTDDEVRTEVVFGGELRENQGINLPRVAVSAAAMTEKDAEDLMFGLSQDVDYVALSFVRRADDITHIRQLIAGAGKKTPVIAKIEKPEALDELNGILAACQGIMVARGDLGVEMPPEEVPVVQKQLIEAANAAGVPVITATQMLDSMIRNPRPTRAEASDVANAIIDGTDAVMLSGETASGKFPLEALQMMVRIADSAEESGRHGDHSVDVRWKIIRQPSIDDAISAAACAVVTALPVRAIVAFTMSGHTARLVSRQRPRVPILAFTPSEETYRRLSLVWGVTPILGEVFERLDDLSHHLTTFLPAQGMAQSGDLIVMTGGHPMSARGVSNLVKVLAIP